jgi:Zn-finger nucleic acid-binding protein
MIKCPKCKTNLETISYENIEVDRCPKCGGIWFDAMEAEELKKIKGSEKLDTIEPAVGHQYNRMIKQINCPRCQTKMQKILDIDRYSIWYEQCVTCSGIWLDAGEFTKFKDNFKLSNLTNLTNYIFRHH